MIDRSKKITGRFYAAASGRRPVREWLLDLSKNDRRGIGKDIQKVEFGWPIGMPYCRALGHGLWEVRSDLSGGRIARVPIAMRYLGAPSKLRPVRDTTRTCFLAVRYRFFPERWQ